MDELKLQPGVFDADTVVNKPEQSDGGGTL